MRNQTNIQVVNGKWEVNGKLWPDMYEHEKLYLNDFISELKAKQFQYELLHRVQGGHHPENRRGQDVLFLRNRTRQSQTG